jgi:hypothetical protein
MAGDSGKLDAIRQALHDLLRERGVLKFASVKPLLASRVSGGFNPQADFECENTGDFLRQFEQELGVDLKKGENDWEVSLASEPSPEPAKVSSVDHYKSVLKSRVPKIYFRSSEEWEYITEKVMEICTQDKEFTLDSLLKRTIAICTDNGLEEYVPTAARNILFQLEYAQCFVPAEGDGGSQRLESDRQIVLAADVPHLDAMRTKTQRAVVFLLRKRLKEEIDQRVLAELFFKDHPQGLERVRKLLQTPDQNA